MGDHGCINGDLDASNYSSPLPFIGLYIAAASVICLLLILYDIYVAVRRTRKQWIPCKFFALNSTMLMLLSIVAKLPLDLTTAMPRSWDQLCKLTGTVVVCISMGVLAPSLGGKTKSGSSTDMLALSIFVITLVINICIQLFTGVIVLFYIEHVIVLGMMLLLLFILWNISWYAEDEKKISLDECKILLAKGNGSMIGRLRLCYLYAYCSNPQFKISRHPMNAASATICLMCSGIFMEAALRSIFQELHLCSSVSDYEWSIAVILISQSLVILVGTLLTVYRWISLFPRMELGNIFISFLDDDDMVQREKTLRKGFTLHRIQELFTSLNKTLILIVQLVIVSPLVLVRNFLGARRHDAIEYFSALPHPNTISAGEYIVKESVNSMIQLRQVSISDVNHLIPFLSNKHTSYPLDLQHIEVSSFSITLLVKIAQVSLPHNHLNSLLEAFGEANEIIHFIDYALQPKSLQNNDRQSYAKALWTGGDFTCLLGDDINGTQDDVNHAIYTINRLKGSLHSSDVNYMVDYITRRRNDSVDDLYASIEQLFLDMLLSLFADLPAAICKTLSESPAEEFEDIARVALKFLFKIGSLENIHWLFPIGYNISRLRAEEDDETRRLTGPLSRLREVLPT